MMSIRISFGICMKPMMRFDLSLAGTELWCDVGERCIGTARTKVSAVAVKSWPLV